jgi:DUF4097 and DUF4098 domain-containing protein YvlB
MPIFDTPRPVPVTIEVPVGFIRLRASDRSDTVIDVVGHDPGLEQDARLAEQTRVEFTGDRLVIRAPKQRGLFGRHGTIDLGVELPNGSGLRAEVAAGNLRAEGRLGDCRIKISAGDIELGDAGSVDLTADAGAVVVRRVDGSAQISTGSGQVRVSEVTGTAVLRNSNGDNWIGHAHGDLRVKAANGGIQVDEAESGVVANTANGAVRLGSVTRGTVQLGTGLGEIEVGIREGTAARLDVATNFGKVRNELTAGDRPGPADETAEIKAHTNYGDIVVRRA